MGCIFSCITKPGESKEYEYNKDDFIYYYNNKEIKEHIDDKSKLYITKIKHHE